MERKKEGPLNEMRGPVTYSGYVIGTLVQRCQLFSLHFKCMKNL